MSSITHHSDIEKLIWCYFSHPRHREAFSRVFAWQTRGQPARNRCFAVSVHALLVAEWTITTIITVHLRLQRVSSNRPFSHAEPIYGCPAWKKQPSHDPPPVKAYLTAAYEWHGWIQMFPNAKTGILFRIPEMKSVTAVWLLNFFKRLHILSRPSKLFLNPEQSVVFCHSVASAGCARLNLSCVPCHCQICDGGVLRFSRPMGHYGFITVFMSHLHRLISFRQSTDLIHLHQNGIGGL